MFTHTHSSSLCLAARLGYTDVAQIILVILRRLDFFQTDFVYHANKKYKKAEVAILLLKKKRKWDIYT